MRNVIMMAAAMLVACGDKEEDTSDTGTDTPVESDPVDTGDSDPEDTGDSDTGE